MASSYSISGGQMAVALAEQDPAAAPCAGGSGAEPTSRSIDFDVSATGNRSARSARRGGCRRSRGPEPCERRGTRLGHVLRPTRFTRHTNSKNDTFCNQIAEPVNPRPVSLQHMPAQEAYAYRYCRQLRNSWTDRELWRLKMTAGTWPLRCTGCPALCGARFGYDKCRSRPI